MIIREREDQGQIEPQPHGEESIRIEEADTPYADWLAGRMYEDRQRALAESLKVTTDENGA